jgi:hypothetical protein
MGFAPHDFDSGQSLDEVMGAFSAFCDASSEEAPLVLVFWGVWTHRWFQAKMADVSCILLKGVWANVSQDRIPGLDVLVNSLGITVPKLPLIGRAGPRLAQAQVLTRYILTGGTSAS